MSERSRNDKGQFAPTVDTEGVPSVQETPEQRERNNLTLVAQICTAWVQFTRESYRESEAHGDYRRHSKHDGDRARGLRTT